MVNTSLFFENPIMTAEMLQKEFLRDIKIHFSSIITNVYLIKYIHMTSKHVYLTKINFYSIKYFYMISKYFFIQSKKICIQKKIFFSHNFFFNPIRIFFYYMKFSFDAFLVTMSGLSFLFAKVRILFTVYKLNSSTML